MDSGIGIRYPFVGFDLLRHIKFLGDNVYELTDSELDQDNGDIEIDGNVYIICGHKSGTHKFIYLMVC